MPNLYVEQLYLIFLNLVVSNWMCNMYYFSVFTDFVLTFFLLGINPVSMRGSKTGVYIGVSGSEAGEAFSKDPEELLGYSMTGCQRAMFANRLSYYFDFNGMQTLQV